MQSLKRGKLKADFQVTKSLYEKAKSGDTGAIIFWLKNRRPDLWRDKQDVQHSGEVKGGATVNIHFDRFLTEYESRFEREYGLCSPQARSE